MSIFKKLERVREKSIETRRRILFLSLAVSMTVVIAIWLSLLKLPGRSENKGGVTGPSPWEVIKNMFNTLPDEIYKRE